MQAHLHAAASFVKKYMEKTQRPQMGLRRTADFRWRHTLRVLEAAREIGRREGADLRVVEMAGLLHDVAKLDYRCDEIHHAVLGSEIAAEFLTGRNLPRQFIRQVVEAVRYHSFDTHRDGLRLETLVLKDADRLDEVGALGVLRTAADHSSSDYRGHFYQGREALKTLEHLPFFTAGGKALFSRRFNFMCQFWQQAAVEMKGESASDYSNVKAP